MYVHIPQSVINLLPLFQFLQMKSLLAVLTTWSNLSVVAFNFDLNLKSINLHICEILVTEECPFEVGCDMPEQNSQMILTLLSFCI